MFPNVLVSCSTLLCSVMKLLQLFYIHAIFSVALQFLVAQASPHSSIFGRAMIQGKSSEQLLHSETLQNNQGFMEDMTRLGSIPPSCRNKCNACDPCKAIQVPTLPNHDQVHNVSPRASSSTETSKKYTNYKPIGWKCKCGNRLFNP